MGREDLLQNMVEKVKESANTASKHHVLLYGPRGIGKTHFIALLKHRIANSPDIGPKIRIAWLNEDETTTSLVQLLVRIYRSLCDEYPDEYSRDWLSDVLDQPPGDIEGMLRRCLVERFRKLTLVILVENLNLLLENLGSDGQQSLRALLQEHPFVCLMATSQQLFKAVTDRNKPFFGFFQDIPLKPLSLADAQQLLLNIARSKRQKDLLAFLQSLDGRSRVRAIHHLAGGNHRVYIVLSGFITRESLDHLVTPFQKMADELTPYYQERLRWISAQQRQIVELLCRVRGTLKPKEIARRLLASENTIGSQVRKLAEIGYLMVARRGRESFYELSEPLMRLAYEVKQQSLLVMLIDFLRIWYAPDEMKTLRTQGYSASTLEYIDAAIERSQTHPDPRIAILEAEIEKAKVEGREQELASIWEEKASVTNAYGDWYNAGYYYAVLNKNYSTSIDCFDKALGIDPKNKIAWNDRGGSLILLGRCDEAIKSLDHALKTDPKYANAWNTKGYSLYKLGRYEEAIKCYDKALETDPEVAYARFNRTEPLFALSRWEEGFESIQDALTLASGKPEYLGEVGSMFAFIFRLSDDETKLKLRVVKLVDIYEEAAEAHKPRDGESQSGKKPPEDPLAWLGNGLVASLGNINSDGLNPTALQSYVSAVEQRMADMPQCEVPLRLFRYGIRYLISKDLAELVELVKPEREILYQALNLSAESE